MPRLSETFVFSLGGDEPLESYSRAKRKLDGLLTDVSAFTWHDLRRTLATNLQRLKVSLPVAEAILNHKSGSISGIAAVYQRHDYADEKRQALERWADRVEALVEGRSDTNVIDMRARKTALAV